MRWALALETSSRWIAALLPDLVGPHTAHDGSELQRSRAAGQLRGHGHEPETSAAVQGLSIAALQDSASGHRCAAHRGVSPMRLLYHHFRPCRLSLSLHLVPPESGI